MSETHHRIRSDALNNERSLWLLPPRDARACSSLVVFLDGEFYRDLVGAPAIYDAARARGEVGDAWLVFVSYRTMDDRWVECPCHPPFNAFVGEELPRFLAREFPQTTSAKHRVLAGLSYTGLAASYVALRSPGVYDVVISQSGSYWWNDEKLTRDFEAAQARLATRFILDVGTKETDFGEHHRPGVYQGISQIAGVRHFRDVVAKLGHRVDYLEFEGDHEMSGWASSLPACLRLALPVQGTPPLAHRS